MNRLAIIADDLTGATDTAACFAQGGLATIVRLGWETGSSSARAVSPEPASGEIDVVSLSTGSRGLSPQVAVRRVERALAWLGGSGFELPETFFYKKIDSMLRGHPALELGALMGTLGLDRALVAPAFPAQGRITRDGWQVISGGRRSSLNHRINLAEVFAGSGRANGQVCRYPVHTVSRAEVQQGWRPDGAGVYVADAETEADLDRLARSAVEGGLHLACGSAGLARSLWRCGVVGAEGRKNRGIRLSSQSASRPSPSPIPAPGAVGASNVAAGNASAGKTPTLVVAGSRSTALERQVQAARDRGVVVVRPGLDWLERVDFQPCGPVTILVETLRGGRAAILTTAGLPESTQEAAQVATRLAEAAGELVENGLVGGLILIGGDTALAVCRRLGASLIGLEGEPVPGVASGVLLDGACPGLPVITRAGGFECDLTWLVNLRA
jgi:uncharacterized protein YgbK (DUF1537 family)